MRRLLLLLLVTLAMAPAGPRAQKAADQPEATLLLQIDAVAVDRNGLPVLDLRPGEVEVWISGYRVPIETFDVVTAEDDRAGRLIVLLLDDMTLHPVHLSRVRDVARRFVDRMAPEDRMAVLSLNGDFMESTADRSRLLEGIGAYHPRATGVLRFDSIGEHVLTTMTSVSRRLTESGQRRLTIVGIGSGWLFDTPIPPPIGGRDLRREWVDAMRAMAFANASLYVIDPAGVGASRVTGGSSGFARETGGHAFTNTNDLNAAADQIMREAGSYYLIGVADPPIQRKADLRELDVRVLRSGLTLRARRRIPGTH